MTEQSPATQASAAEASATEASAAAPGHRRGLGRWALLAGGLAVALIVAACVVVLVKAHTAQQRRTAQARAVDAAITDALAFNTYDHRRDLGKQLDANRARLTGGALSDFDKTRASVQQFYTQSAFTTRARLRASAVAASGLTSVQVEVALDVDESRDGVATPTNNNPLCVVSGPVLTCPSNQQLTMVKQRGRWLVSDVKEIVGQEPGA